MYYYLTKSKRFFSLIFLILGITVILASCNFHTHVNSREEVTKEPTCTEEGEITRYCKCGEIYEKKSLSPLGHSMNDNDYCDRCNLSVYIFTNLSANEVYISGATAPLLGDIVLPAVSPDGKKVTGISSWLFKNSSVTSVVIPDGVTAIDDKTFQYCGTLKSITLPKTITSIGENAFERCTSLESIELHEGITKIGSEAFKDCKSLKSITLPTSWEYDKLNSYRYFIGCDALESITMPYLAAGAPLSYLFEDKPFGYEIPDSIKEIVILGGDSLPYRAFKSFKSVERIILPQSLTKINSEAFYDCHSLKEIYIPDTVCSIDTKAFTNCYSITSVNIPDGIVTIPFGLFLNCTSLTEISLPDSLTTIKAQAFMNSGLESITLPDCIENISSNTFSGCSNLVTVNLPATLEEISGNAFEGCSSLKEILLPDSLTTIGARAFCNCTSLKSFVIHYGITTVESSILEGCTSLENVSILTNTESIESKILSGCTSLKALTVHNLSKDFGFFFGGADYLPQSLKSVVILTGNSIPEAAFRYCQYLESIALPDELTEIPVYAFKGCSSLKNILLPDGLSAIAECAFEGCSSLESINLPSGISKIPFACFTGCSSLKTIDIPISVKTIQASAFDGCSSLTSVYIPTSVNYIGKAAFGDCTSLESITLPLTAYYWDRFDYEAHFGYIFGYTTSKTPVEKYHIVSMNNSAGYAFYVTYNIPESLKSIVILDGITTINRNTFHCINGPTSIVIPKSVVCIESSSFYNFASLSNVYYTGSENEWNTIVGKENIESLTNATIHYNYVWAE